MKRSTIFEKMWNSSEQPDTDEQAEDVSSNEQSADSEDNTILGLSDLYVPKDSSQSHIYDIIDVLRDNSKLTEKQYNQIREQCQTGQNQTDSNIEQALLKTNLLSEDDILKAKAKLYDMEFQHINAESIDSEAFKKFSIDFIKTNLICPVEIKNDKLVVAISDPTNNFAIEEAKTLAEMDLQVVLCKAEDITTICNLLQQDQHFDELDKYCIDDLISDMADIEVVVEEKNDFEDLEKIAEQSPVIKFVNYLISNAIHEEASDIHIEPKEKFTKIRYRIDGVLFETMRPPINMHSAVVSRIKIMSNLNISERRLPQDGKISVIVGGRRVDLRVSTLPTNYGEKVVIRVLDSKSIMRGLEELGMEPKVTAVFQEQIAMPHGILLVSGPTGSGKSTTLYSALGQMDGEKLNVSTVEDPIEYDLSFCNQIQTNEAIGLTFASALRSLLRQDPDIIMIGEIRDNETARIAVQAALTGHLVLSTLHTNDAPSSITRLVNIGIDPYLIAASLNAVLAQRLVRKICSNCKELYHLPDNMQKCVEKAGVGKDQLFHGAGCESCRGSGYQGRIGIYELLVIDDIFRDMINKDTSINHMRQVFHKSEQPSLFDDGIEKIRHGLTTIEEVLRVTEVYGQSQDEVFEENTA